MPASQLRRRMHPVVRHHDKPVAQGPRILGAGSIALISLAAVLTLRGFPSVAEYGWSSIAFYLMGTLFFFLPLALVAAELATGWPRAGGLYAWVKQAFSVTAQGSWRSGLSGSRTSCGSRRSCPSSRRRSPT